MKVAAQAAALYVYASTPWTVLRVATLCAFVSPVVGLAFVFILSCFVYLESYGARYTGVAISGVLALVLAVSVGWQYATIRQRLWQARCEMVDFRKAS